MYIKQHFLPLYAFFFKEGIKVSWHLSIVQTKNIPYNKVKDTNQLHIFILYCWDGEELQWTYLNILMKKKAMKIHL